MATEANSMSAIKVVFCCMMARVGCKSRSCFNQQELVRVKKSNIKLLVEVQGTKEQARIKQEVKNPAQLRLSRCELKLEGN